MASERLQIIIDATFSGKRGIEQAGRELKKLDQEAAKASEGSKYMSQQYKQMAQNVVGYAGAAAAGVSVAWKTIGAGAELELAQSRYENLAASIGADSDAMLSAMTTASGGMVSQAQLIASAGQIISLGLADTKDDVVDLAALSTQLGWDMQQVILTFANNSTMRLDALGLSVEDVTAKAKILEAQGYSTDKAFDLAVIEAGKEKLALLGSAADTTSGAMQRLEVVFTDTKNSLLELIATRSEGAIVGAANYYDAMKQALGDLEAAQKSGYITQGQYISGWLDIMTVWGDGNKILEEARATQHAMNTTTAYYIGMGELAAKANVHVADTSAMVTSEMYYATQAQDAASNSIHATALALAKQAEEAERAVSPIQSVGVESFYASQAQDAAKNSIHATALAMAQQAIEAENVAEALAKASAFNDTFVDALNNSTDAFTTNSVNADMLNESLFDQIAAMSDNAVVTASAAYALGLYDETQLETALNAAIISEKINQLAESFVNGEITAGQMKERMDEIVESSPYTSEIDVLTDEAIGAINSVKDALDKIPRNITSKVTVVTENKTSNGAGGGGATDSGGASGGRGGGTQGNYATGTNGWQTVPPGFPNDSYMVGLQSGESFNVVPAGQSGGGSTNSTIEISFAGANFYGTPQNMANQMATMVADKLGRL